MHDADQKRGLLAKRLTEACEPEQARRGVFGDF